MKKQLLFIIGILTCSLGYSQSVSPEVIASSGEHFSGTNTQLSWTIGEIMIETYTNDSTQLTQGFHQTNLMITAVEDLADNLAIKVFPNPTTDMVNIEWSEPVGGYTLMLYDVKGQQLLIQKAISQTLSGTLDLSTYAAGSYFLHLSNPEGKTIKTFKIIKIK